MSWGFFGTVDHGRRLAVDDTVLAHVLGNQPVSSRALYCLSSGSAQQQQLPSVVGLTLTRPLVAFDYSSGASAEGAAAAMLMEILADICRFSNEAAGSVGRENVGIVLAVREWQMMDSCSARRFVRSMCSVILEKAAAHVLFILHHDSSSDIVREVLEDGMFAGRVSRFEVSEVTVQNGLLTDRSLSCQASKQQQCHTTETPKEASQTAPRRSREGVTSDDSACEQQQVDDAQAQVENHVALSILPHLDRVLEALHTSPSRCIILDGPTGCGKSTQVPMALVKSNPTFRLWVTQPRRMAALSLCRRVNMVSGGEMDAAYSIGGRSSEQRTSRVVFMTPGVLLKRVKAAFRSASFLQDVSVTHILLDEVHERTVETDILCCLLRELLKYNSMIRLVLMSATLSCDEMQLYMYRGFASPRHAGSWCRTPIAQANSTEGSCIEEVAIAQRVVPIVRIPPHVRQRRFVYVRDIYRCVNDDMLPDDVLKEGRTGSSCIPKRLSLELADVAQGPTQPRDAGPSTPGTPPSAYLTDARRELLVGLVSFIHKRYPIEQSVLIFVSGLAMIERLEAELQLAFPTPLSEGDSGEGQIHTIALHSANDTNRGMKELFQEDKKDDSATTDVARHLDISPRVANDGKSRRRKVIIATNIAESSITVPHVDHVIDTCLVKDQQYSYEDQMPQLVERFASRDSCEQRAGRTGRLRMGTVWRLCTEAEYQGFDFGRMPGMLQASLLSTILLVADAHVGELDSFIAALPTPPPAQFVASSIFSLRDHYGAITLGSVESPHVSLTSRGVVLAALGIDVPLGHLVLLGLSLDLLMQSVQAAAILSTVGNFVKDDGVAHLIDFDSETGCDVLALVQVYRAWVRRNTSTLLVLEVETWKKVDAMVRPHVAVDVREKTLDIIKQLDQFGLASRYYAALLESGGAATINTSHGGGEADEHQVSLSTALCWEDAADVAALSGRDAISFISLLSLAFVRNTLTTQQTPAQTRVIRRYGHRVPHDMPFVPYHEVIVKHTLIPTALDLENLQRWLGPSAHVSRDDSSELKSKVRFRVDRIVTYHGKPGEPVVLGDEYACRIVRGTITHDAYKLLKIGREDSRRFNIAFCDCPAETHLASSWFVEVKSPFFIDRVSLLYPLVADLKNPTCPSLVACQLQKRRRHIAVQQVLSLPGGLSYFPLCAALLVHWDGRTVEDGGHSAVIKSLQHCHPDVKKIERFGVELNDVIILNDRLRSFYMTQLDELLGSRGMSVAESSVIRRGGGGGGLFSSMGQREAWLEGRESRARANRELLDLIVCRYLRDLPMHFAPRAVREFKQRYKSKLPLQLLVQLGSLRDLDETSSNHGVIEHEGSSLPAPPHLIALSSEAMQAKIGAELERVLELNCPIGLAAVRTAVLPAQRRMNEFITSGMLRDFRIAQLSKNIRGGSGEPSCFGVPLRSSLAPEDDFSGFSSAAGSVPLPALRFQRYYAQRYLSDLTLQSAFSLYVWPFLSARRMAGSMTSEEEVPPSSFGWNFFEPMAETTCGLLSFWALNAVGSEHQSLHGRHGTSRATSMTLTTASCNVLEENFRLLERYGRYSNSSLSILPIVDVWADAEKAITNSSTIDGATKQETAEVNEVILAYLPPAAGRSRQPGGAELASAAQPPVLESDEERLMRFLIVHASQGEHRNHRNQFMLLFVHHSRYVILQQLRDGDPGEFAKIFGRPMVETLLHDELVGDVVLIASLLSG